ncbi:PREDICTED: uncharacterized protein LOC106809702 [Priapulus caudatus]|uniref:Uncharacterized protein LOC106809702 n=1 Tax=Priapulus caudatus TaxID=37621 RepID=A0ABM1E836_PRICU|nr:PREDICTED: uncharacterized protein LOC106809702 [Priapulus caudatus]
MQGIIVERLLQAAYSKTDATLLGIEDWPRAHDEDENFRSQAALQSHITRHRTRLLLASQEAGFCADVQTKLLGYVEDMAHDPPGETRWAWKEMLAFYLLMNSKEHTSGERAVGSQFFASGNLTQSGLTTYHREETLGKFYLSMAADYHSEFEKAEYHMLTESTLQKTIINMHKNILENKWRQPSTERALWWFGNMTEYIEILSEAAVRLGEHTLLEMTEGSHRKQLHRAVVAGAILIVFALLLWPILLTLLILIVHRIQMFYNYLKAEGKKRGTQFDASTSKS